MSHEGAVLAEFPSCHTLVSADKDAALCVLRTHGATKGILITPIPAAWRMAAAKDAAPPAKAWSTSLQLPSLLHAGLPQVMTDVAEMGGAKAEVVGLPFTTVAALPTQEISAMFRTLQLSL